MSHDRTKLPRWAQDEFDLLEARVRDQSKTLDLLRGGLDTMTVVNEDYGDNRFDNSFCIPDGSRIRFYLDGERGVSKPWIEIRRDDGYNKGWLYVTSDATDRELAVRPSSSNVLKLGQCERPE